MKYVDGHGKRIAVDTINTDTPAKRRKPFEVRFVKLSNYWIERLERSNNPGAFKLAHRILRQRFKRQWLRGRDCPIHRNYRAIP